MATPPQGRTALYRLYDANGTLLYVGITTNPRQRWTEHAMSKAWWDEVCSKTVEWFEVRIEAARAEAVAVRVERPMWNLALPSEDGSASFKLITPRPTRPGAARRQPRRRPAVPSGTRSFPTTKDLWERFSQAVANSPDHEADMSKVLRQFVRWYCHETGAKIPDRPAVGPWSKPGSTED